MAGTSRVGRRTFLRPSAAARLAGDAGVTAATPRRAPGPKEDEVLVGVSKTAGSPRVVIEAHVTGDERVVHENETLGYAAVKSLAEAPDQASENVISASDTALGRPSVTVADEYHGTHVAGIAAGTADDDDGTGGISNSSLLSGRAPSEDEHGRRVTR